MSLDTPSTRKSSLASTIHSTTVPSEDTPLLERKQSRVEQLWHKSTVYRVLLTSFLVSLSFGVTQVPLIYVFGTMTCEEYYRHHPLPPLGTPAWDRRCMVHEIEGSTARSVVDSSPRLRLVLLRPTSPRRRLLPSQLCGAAATQKALVC